MKRIQLRHLRQVCFALISILALTSCTAQDLGSGSSVLPNQTLADAATCSITGSVVMQGSTTPTQVVAGATVIWQVNASSTCSNLFAVPPSGAPVAIPAGQNYAVYSETYSTVESNIAETVTIQAEDSSGNVLGSTSVSSSQFSVVAAPSTGLPVSCELTATPGSASGSFNMVATLSSPGTIISVIDIAGNVVNTPDPTQAPAASSFSFTSQVSASGLNPMIITVASPSAPGFINSCLALAQGTAGVITPVLPNAPTCNVVVSASTVNIGQAVAVSLQTTGTISEWSIMFNGIAIGSSGNAFDFVPTQSGTIQANLTGPGGVAQCGQSITVVPIITKTMTCYSPGPAVSCDVGGHIVDYHAIWWNNKCGAGNTCGERATGDAFWVTGGCDYEVEVTYIPY
jgi:hypothetical protein